MDGDLRRLFRQHLPAFQWTAIESGATGLGIPDSEYCAPCGTSGWIEHKKSSAWKLDHNLTPFQVGWHQKRARMRGRSFIAVRRETFAGPRKGPAADELWLIRGTGGAQLRVGGLKAVDNHQVLGIWFGGPGKWFWEAVGLLLTR